jgi:L-threonylcarbamoyladenylate synthase
MKTDLVPLTRESVARAVTLLDAGEVVAFPTETVYGLGARADDDEAIARIYQAKGRPPDKALIVHVRDRAQARTLTSEWDERAEALALAFWPGPLTLVVARGAGVADRATAGGVTVALRAPAHPGAQELLAACRFALAAPSANPSGAPAPTTAAEVLRGLDGRIPLILDGGTTPLKEASTIVDLTSSGAARILRQGALGREAIAAVVTLADPSGG